MTETNKKYFEAVGRRKTSVARVRITPSTKTSIRINDKSLVDYFTVKEDQASVNAPLDESDQNFEITVITQGGGVASQAIAVRHGIARAMMGYSAGLRTPLKKLGFLKRDPRAKERRKPGRKKARKGPRWSKR